jgi:RND family efflux transporter MFP subunit
VATARQQLRRTEVRAPFDGVVSERRVSVGDTAAVGKELVKVIDPRSMRFEGLVSADRMHELKIGQAVSFRVNGFPQNDFVGRVHRVDATTRQVEVLVTFADPASAPRVAGLFAEGRIEASTTQALVLPESAIVRESAGTAVWRVKEQKVSKTPVQLAERDARTGQFVVLAGLAAGDQVLRNPGSTLKEGQRVEFTRPSASAASANAAGTPVARQ